MPDISFQTKGLTVAATTRDIYSSALLLCVTPLHSHYGHFRSLVATKNNNMVTAVIQDGDSTILVKQSVEFTK